MTLESVSPVSGKTGTGFYDSVNLLDQTESMYCGLIIIISHNVFILKNSP